MRESDITLLSEKSANRSFIVYYVVGRPRTGSTFVGDWIARNLNILNAGEVFQTFRTMDRLKLNGRRRTRWERTEHKHDKAASIMSDGFWSDVLARPEVDPYAALIAMVRLKGGCAVVDSSKNAFGIQRYKSLGCEVVVIHTLRAFGSWQRSILKNEERYNLKKTCQLRLLLNYLRSNSRFRRLKKDFAYYAVPQEQLVDISRLLNFDAQPERQEMGYSNAEMFGTRDFTGEFDVNRMTQRVSVFDALLYRCLGIKVQLWQL